MSTREHLHSVVASLQPVIQGVPADAMQRPTPCPDWDVRTLLNHMLGTVEAMRRVGAGEPPDPDDPWGTRGEHVTEEWRRSLSELLTRFASQWFDPRAWEGDAMDGAMPRALVGDMGFAEVMLHGWDLARATGQELEYDEPAAARAREILEMIGPQGRSHGVFGEEVQVPADASDFTRTLGLAGRDPEWHA